MSRSVAGFAGRGDTGLRRVFGLGLRLRRELRTTGWRRLAHGLHQGAGGNQFLSRRLTHQGKNDRRACRRSDRGCDYNETHRYAESSGLEPDNPILS